MSYNTKLIHKTYGNRLRVRVCGICIEQERLLMIKHTGLSEKGYFLSPPGGGMQFGEDAYSCLQREFREETGLEIVVNDFLFIHEIMQPPLHAMELFFSVKVTAGILELGQDPEMAENQMLESVQFMSYPEIMKEKGPQLHAIFNHCSSLNDLLHLRGYFKFDNKKRY